MSNNLFLPILLQFAGVAIIIAEIIIPSGGLLGILAAGLIGWSLFEVFSGVSVAAGMYFVTADVVILPVLVLVGLKILAKSPATLRKELSSANGVTSQDAESERLVGMSGVALTDLRPAGAAQIGGKRMDVVTPGDYLEKGREIIVQSVTGNQIIVDCKDED